MAEIPNDYSLVTDLKTLVEAINVRLRSATRKHSKVPMIHLSMHGNETGIYLTDGKFVSWRHLRHELLPVMRAVNGTLLFCISFCVSYAGVQMAMNSDDEPSFWALVGYTGAASWSDAAIAFSCFYYLFFKNVDIDICVNSIRIASGDSNFVFHLGEETKLNWYSYLKEKGEAKIQSAINAP